jgi:hypothetical protein
VPRLALLLAILGTLGCGAAPTKLEDLPPPTLSWRQDNSMCVKLRTVDGHRNSWRLSTCDVGVPELMKVGVVSAADLDELTAAFAALPFGTDGPACGPRVTHSFVRKRDATQLDETSTCSHLAFDDTSDLTPELATAANAFLRITGP